MNVITSEESIRRISTNVGHAMGISGISLRGLASAVDEPVTTVHSLVHGKNDARVSLVARIAEHFQVTVDDLLLPEKQFRKILKKLAIAG